VREEGAQPLPELLVGRHVALCRPVPHSLDERGALPPYAGSEEALLGLEIEIDERLGDPGLLGYLVHRRGLIAVSGEADDRGVQHLPLPHLPRHPPTDPAALALGAHCSAPPPRLPTAPRT
jgi:hypothetical protein